MFATTWLGMVTQIDMVHRALKAATTTSPKAPAESDECSIKGEIDVITKRKLYACAISTALLGLGAVAGCAPQPAPTPMATETDQGSTTGTVTFTGGAVALGIGFQWGSGTLTYNGATYPFRVSGLSVIDVGASRISATGRVRNLRNLADFNGNYVAATASATVAGGAGATALRNQNGVIIDGISTSQGLRFTLAAGGVNIALTQR